MSELMIEDRARAASAPGSVFSPRLLVRTLERENGRYRHLDLVTVLQVTKRWRDAILTYSSGLSDRAREILSGHYRGGAPLEGPHLAFLPLALVGNGTADGRLLGMALALPINVESVARREVLHAIAAVRHLALGRLGRWKVIDHTDSSPTSNLNSEVWTAHPHGATHWSTVTPVVFDRHPKADRSDRYHQEVAAMIRKACTRIGLPEPREVIATPVSMHFGAPPAFAFPRLSRKDSGERRQTHAVLVFEEPVCGPIVLGAGRYRGYGFCLPIDAVHANVEATAVDCRRSRAGRSGMSEAFRMELR